MPHARVRGCFLSRGAVLRIGWLLVVVYCVGMLAVGIHFARQAGRSPEDYFVGGRRMPWWLIGLADVSPYGAANAPFVMLFYLGGFAEFWLVAWVTWSIWMPYSKRAGEFPRRGGGGMVVLARVHSSVFRGRRGRSGEACLTGSEAEGIRLKDKAALITGAARGTGKATAALFAREGARVMIAGVDERAGAHVSREVDVARLIATTLDSLGRLDVLVNNAAPWSGEGRILEVEEETWSKVPDDSLKSTYLCSKHALPHLIRAGAGSIVNISSVNALLGVHVTAYTAGKDGVIALTRLLASNYGRHGVLCPGSIETEGVRPEFERNPAMREKLVAVMQLGRIGKPDDVAYGALYLASEESSFATGAVLVIDGVLTAGLSPERPVVEERAL